MNTLFTYFVQSAAGMLLFYSVYKLFLQQETMFKLNRFYLLAALVISLTAPLFNIQFRVQSTTQSIENQYKKFNFFPWQNAKFYTTNADASTQTPMLLKEVNIYADKILEKKPRKMLINNAMVFSTLSMLYLAGVVLFSFRFVYQLVSLLFLISKGKKQRVPNATIVYSRDDVVPFSFFRTIVLPQHNSSSKAEDEIIQHESIHIRQWHYIDLLFAEIVTILLWFNPLSWLYKNSIKENHEYLADNGVIALGFDKSRYQQLLINHVVGTELFTLSSSFSKSLTKKRIIMMSKIESPRLAALKVSLMIPVVLFLLFAFAEPQYIIAQTDAPKTIEPDTLIDGEPVYNVVENMPEFEGGTTALGMFIIENIQYPLEAKKNNIQGKVYVRLETPASTETNDSIYFVVEQMPEYLGGEEALRTFLAENIQYPDEARKAGVEGKVYVRFAIMPDGKVDKTSIARGVDKLLDDEALRVVALLPNWKPALHEGKPVAVWFTVPISFQLSEEKNSLPDNKPLIMIDGVKFEGNLNTIAPDNIESVEVLKSKNALDLYGNANGVILITMKKSHSNQSEVGSLNIPAIVATVFPNPSKDKFTIQLTSPSKGTNIQVFDLQGKLIMEKDPNMENTEIDLSGFAASSYVLKVVNNNQMQVIHLVKE